MPKLKLPEVLNIIDENTDLRRKKSLTWDIIFKHAELFVVNELESIGLLTATYLQKRQKVLYSSFDGLINPSAVGRAVSLVSHRLWFPILL